MTSFPRICVALGFTTPAELTQAAEREYKDGNTFLEWRLDYLADPSCGIDPIKAFQVSRPDLQILATCRLKQNHGCFNGAVEQQLTILREAGQAGAAMLDLEVESAEPAKARIPELRAVAPVAISYHNFESTPALGPVLRRLQKIPADAYKIATTARKPSDNLRLLDFTRANHSDPLIALAMSETGTVSRLLAPSHGGLFTFASPLDAAGTAPGQISAKLMRSLYRSDKLSKNTRVYGVIADPVAHSKSPLIHNRAFHARRVDAVYVPFRVGATQLSDWMKLAADLPVAGFSVTIPHKQKILRYLDVIDPLAKRIGAVNTVWRKGGKWRGANTDTQGIIKPLGQNLRLAHASILIAGYGGAARTAAFALLDAGADLTITGRNMKSVQALAQAVKAKAATISEAEAAHYDALVHATPVGMHPKPDQCLFTKIIPADVVMDMVYNPHETLLLQRALKQGCKVTYGAEMLLEQAACQFEIWTGEPAPRALMQTALLGPTH